jgi:L-2-hydroxyglutarate oxidase
MKTYDIAILGGGIVGLSTAYTLSKHYPNLSTVVIEKENTLGFHQSSRNSGVVHSGIYYKPGSLKAENCIKGKKLLLEFCDKHSISYKTCGKIIVASFNSETENLQKLYERGLSHGIDCKLVGPEELREIEPYLKGISGIHIPSVAIIKFADVVNKLSSLILESGKEIKLQSKIFGIKTDGPGHIILTSGGEVRAKYLVNTAGLFCDEIARMGMKDVPLKIIPFRGEYYELKESAKKYCNALIYPVPNPDYPFLGVHVTRMIDGKVECGPNAVLAMAREGYKWSDFNLKDLLGTFTYPGFLKFAVKNLPTGIYEVMRSLNKSMFLKSVQNLIPSIQDEDLTPGSAGIRAQAITATGKIVDDFFILEGEQQLHVLNAPSPAATSCLSVGESIVDRIVKSNSVN